jgi:hypothetical protein
MKHPRGKSLLQGRNYVHSKQMQPDHLQKVFEAEYARLAEEAAEKDNKVRQLRKKT